jgi:hypothetical protein
MRVASEMILELSIEQELDGVAWPHPWDHYPFFRNGRYFWLRYQDLGPDQREQVRCALVQVRRRLGGLVTSPGFA